MFFSLDLDVTRAAEAAWVAYGEAPVSIDPQSVGVAPASDKALPVHMLRLNSTRCFEAFFGADQHDLGAAAGFLSLLGAPGWSVTAVVPLSSLGAAHEAFRAADVVLQAWWRDGEGKVRFSSCERA